VSWRDSVLAGNRPNPSSCRSRQQAGEDPATSRLRTRLHAAAWPGGTRLCPAAAAMRSARVSWTGVSAVTEPPSGLPAERVAAGVAGQPEVALVCGKSSGYRVRPADLRRVGQAWGAVQIRIAAALTAGQPGRAGRPACYLAVHDHGRLATQNRRAAVAGLTRPRKHAGTLGAQPQPRVTGIKRFLQCGGGRQTACALRAVSAVHRSPPGR
jgi:hypothetical protein